MQKGITAKNLVNKTTTLSKSKTPLTSKTCTEGSSSRLLPPPTQKSKDLFQFGRVFLHVHLIQNPFPCPLPCNTRSSCCRPMPITFNSKVTIPPLIIKKNKYSSYLIHFFQCSGCTNINSSLTEPGTILMKVLVQI